MGGSAIKLGVGVFFVWLSAQMGQFAEEVLGRVRESVQASELLTIDSHVGAWTVLQARTIPPLNQHQFEEALIEQLSARGNRDVTLDRWEQPYLYELQQKRAPIKWRITSGGPDAAIGTGDDLVVERVGDRTEINRDPVEIAEAALDDKLELDREAARRLRELLEGSGEDEGTAEIDAPTHPGPDVEAVSAEDLETLRSLVDESLSDLDALLDH
ncbi:hypothetical protein OAX78_01950 [Planctomycetota bacterium]|nr:hypothetical protein [Planctomycetota bacterium]